MILHDCVLGKGSVFCLNQNINPHCFQGTLSQLVVLFSCQTLEERVLPVAYEVGKPSAELLLVWLPGNTEASHSEGG